jgi:hypothetical protein
MTLRSLIPRHGSPFSQLDDLKESNSEEDKSGLDRNPKEEPPIKGNPPGKRGRKRHGSSFSQLDDPKESNSEEDKSGLDPNPKEEPPIAPVKGNPPGKRGRGVSGLVVLLVSWRTACQTILLQQRRKGSLCNEPVNI